MDNLLTNADLILEQAERMHALALGESDLKRKRLMYAVAEHYYLLHDRLQELGQMDLGHNVVSLAAAKL
jgi:hypothetical protein